jgi:hypothetical protein
MTLPPKFAGLQLTAQNSETNKTPTGTHTLELYLDYTCPFSAKLFKTVTSSRLNKPLLSNSSLLTIFRPQIQPWHPSSMLVHEAATAVLRLAPSQFTAYSALLFERQKEYFDVSVVNETRNATYKRLARLAAELPGIEEDEVYKLLEISDRPAEDGSLNTGNKVTDDVKRMVRMNRLVGVHVTPTAVFDGVVDGGISSSWTVEQWEEWVRKNVV